MSVDRRLLAVLAVITVLVALAVSAPAGASGDDAVRCTTYTVLKADNEVPPTTSRAFGAALVHVNGTKLLFSVAIVNPARETFTAGHIHLGAAGANGGVVVPLFAGSTDRKLIFQVDRRDITAELGAAICGDPAGYYVNYHTDVFPGGAIRGQLTRG